MLLVALQQGNCLLHGVGTHAVQRILCQLRSVLLVLELGQWSARAVTAAAREPVYFIQLRRAVPCSFFQLRRNHLVFMFSDVLQPPAHQLAG